MNIEKKELWDAFLQEWPLERLQSMLLEEYTNLNREDSFCFWLESKTTGLGSIWGGSSYKFGIYHRRKSAKEDPRSEYTTKGNYSWVLKYGQTKEAAFSAVRENIVAVASFALDNDLEKIEGVDLGHTVKWKIAALYNRQIPLVYSKDAIVFLCDNFTIDKKLPYSDKLRKLAALNSGKDILSHSEALWTLWDEHRKGGFPPKTNNGDTNYWLFQGNPKIYNIVGSLKDNALKSWSVSAHKDKIKIGDKIILWLTGEKSGCYALARVTSGIANRLDDDIEQKYYTDLSKLQSTDRVKIAIEYNLWNNPVLKEVLIDLPEFQGFNGGNKGTNFAASQLHYETILKHVNMIGSNHFPLNQIFFGPPGTGKTYNTSGEAIRIADPDFYVANINDRGKLKERFRELLINDWKNPQKGQISFCTFHQSFSYEDFIEGIKPVVEQQEEINEEDNYLKYDIEDGIFKKLADRARYFASSEAKKDKQRISLTDEDFKSAQFYKVSLGNISIPEDQAIYDYCIENDLISVGFMDNWDLTGKTESELYKLIEGTKLSNYEPQAMNCFIHYLKKGNFVIISKGKDKVRAIGKVTGDYFHKPDAPINYTQFRKVEWIIKNADIPVEEIYQKSLMQKTIYKLNKDWVNKEFFVQAPAAPIKEEQHNFVLIIDEINRGNISQIFGELITLIEDDKREGKPEQLEVTLPYSKEKFSVPANLHIIGTMNTADRSIEALDTALRRRFTFVEMAPKPELISEVGRSKGMIEDIDLVKLLTTINERIEKLIDKDHQIGHSYFLDIASFDELKLAFKNKMIPLLEEYFYGDFGKIGLVLGSGFVIPKKMNDFSFADFKGFDDDIITDLKERKVYEITGSEAWGVEDFKNIYQK
ncbi:MAG: EVE domain-containing protein [Bacteroidales bacterium]|nr:EVE domain-containing protein [Bacteroidales bacterium]